MKIRLSKFAFILATLVTPNVVSAVTLIPSCATGEGNCSTCDMAVLFLNFAELITIWISAAVLFSFVWGGVLWVISAGNSEKVQRGKQVMTGAVIGLFLVGAGYTIVNFSIGALIAADKMDQVKIFGTNWNEFCTEKPATTPAATPTNGQCAADADCKTGDCANGSCSCSNGTCVSKCSVKAKTTDGKTGVCKGTSSQCTNSGGIVYSSSGDCLSDAPVCCQLGVGGTAICQRTDETQCNSTCVGETCKTPGDQTATGYVCNKSSQCVTGCTAVYEGRALAFCVPQVNCDTSAGFTVVTDPSASCPSGNICCVQTSQ